MDGREGGLTAALQQIHGVDIDEAAVRAHVMRPGHLLGVTSDQGREGAPARHFIWPPGPVLYRFDVIGFMRALEEQLTGHVAGYSIRLTENGSAGWHMTVDELLKVMAAFRRSDAIVSTAQAQAMLDDSFGIDWSEPTPLGRYHAKNGFWYDDSGQMEQGVAFFLPQNMELVVLVNSPVGNGPTGQFLYTVVSETYIAHIEELTMLPAD